MSKVPDEWGNSKLSNMLYRPLAYGVLKPGEYEKAGIPLIRIQDIRQGRIDFHSLFKISKTLHNEYRRTALHCGDLIISLVGTIGKIYEIPPFLQGANISRAFGVIGLKKGYIREFVKQFLSSDIVIERIMEASQGNAQKVLNLGSLRDFTIPLPSLEEQKKIAEILSSVDRSIEATEKLIAKLSDLKKALMQELFSKGIGHTRFKDTPLGRIPEEWETIPLSDAVKKERKISYGIVQTGDYIPNGIPCVRVVDISSENLDPKQMITTTLEISNSYKKTILKEGDIMFPLRGEIGKVAIVNKKLEGANLTRGVALISPNKLFLSEFLVQAIGSPAVCVEIANQINGTALKEVPLEGLRKVKVPLPSLSEQNQIALTLSAEDKKIEKAKSRLEKLKDLKKGLMQDLLTGNVRVSVGVETVQELPKARKVPVAFKRAVLAAEILDKLHWHQTMGRVKLQKLIYLCESYAELEEELQGQYLRDAAGPFDNRMMRSVHKRLEEAQWYHPKIRDKGCRYLPMQNAGGHKQYYEHYWVDKHDKIERIIKLFRSARTDQCEIPATVYAAWNDLLIEGRNATEDEIVREVFNWHDKKKEIAETRWRSAITWMKEKGLVPQGRGEHTRIKKK